MKLLNTLDSEVFSLSISDGFIHDYYSWEFRRKDFSNIILPLFKNSKHLKRFILGNKGFSYFILLNDFGFRFLVTEGDEMTSKHLLSANKIINFCSAYSNIYDYFSNKGHAVLINTNGAILVYGF